MDFLLCAIEPIVTSCRGTSPTCGLPGQTNGLQGIGPCMSDNPLDQVSDLVRALNTLSLALENNPQQRAPAAASAAPAGSSPAREDSFELITEEPSPSQVQGIRTQPVQIAYNNNSFAETIPPVPHWILRDCQSLVAGELGKQALNNPHFARQSQDTSSISEPSTSSKGLRHPSSTWIGSTNKSVKRFGFLQDHRTPGRKQRGVPLFPIIV